jgi:hypothetical protein
MDIQEQVTQLLADLDKKEKRDKKNVQSRIRNEAKFLEKLGKNYSQCLTEPQWDWELVDDVLVQISDLITIMRAEIAARDNE